LHKFLTIEKIIAFSEKTNMNDFGNFTPRIEVELTNKVTLYNI